MINNRRTLAALLLSVSLAPALAAQVRHPSWTLTGGVEVLLAGKRSWGTGPLLAIRHDFGPHWGAELKAALPAFGSNSGGAAVDLGATYTEWHGATEVGGMLGVTAFLVGDQSELVGGGVGVVAAAHVTRWLTPGFGVTAGANLRTGIGAYPAAYAGLAVRF
jgi:hypothetical protein